MRLALTGLLSTAVLLVAIRWQAGVWPAPIWKSFAILLPVAITAGGLGVAAGLVLQRSIPAFLVGLVLRFFVLTWVIHLALLAAGSAAIARGSWIMWKGKRPPGTLRRFNIKLPEGAVYILVGGALIAYFVATSWR